WGYVVGDVAGSFGGSAVEQVGDGSEDWVDVDWGLGYQHRGECGGGVYGVGNLGH
ncbi:hypothetical protein LTR48_002406, partial [Friedmanniomyces endolithicus]